MKRVFAASSFVIVVALGAALSATAYSHQPIKQPIELGKVAWQRDFDQAQAAAAANSRPLMVLFQEVPG